MKAALTSEEMQLADYLLGRLAEPERCAITERVLADDEVYQSVLAVEEILIDAYAAGDLDKGEAALVEATLLATEQGRVKLVVSRALLQRQRREEARRRQRRWLGVAAAVLLAGGIGFGMFELRPGSVAVAPAVNIVLQPEVYREKSVVQPVEIPAGGGAVSFEFALAAADRAERYEVRVRRPDRGEQVVAGQQWGEAVRFVLGRAALRPGRYEFELYAVDGSVLRLIAFAPADLK